MKIIISRKGFDGANGKCANPIFENGDMLSMPIPCDESSGLKFDDIVYNGKTYEQIWSELSKTAYDTYEYKYCHLDPDIRDGIRKEKIKEWKPAFGQVGAAQGYLNNKNIEPGDIFLFFGTFHYVEEKDGKLVYCRKCGTDFYKNSDLNVIYGYLQVKEIITDFDRIKNEYSWHPHSKLNNKLNALYIPTDHLEIDGKRFDKKGYGTLKFDKKRVLTKEGYSKANWIKRDFYMPDNIIDHRKNSSKSDETVFYQGIWQEIVLKETTEELTNWVKNLII